MKLSKLALVAAIACGIQGGVASAQQAATGVSQVSHLAASCDCGQPACGCEAPAGYCGTGGCDSGWDFGSCFDRLDNGCLGEPWTLFGEHCGWTAGGWVQTGYHTARLENFNTRPDEVQLHQAWLYAQKKINTRNGFDIGGRIDYVYGTDGQDLQAFGTSPSGWDNDWDNGSDYGHALPQVYFEAGYGDLSIKIGHFFSIVGWETVAAPDNFFYSHSYTRYNSEPFTHTGALATYKVSDDVAVYGGYVMGWNSGFDDNGDAFLGGTSLRLTEDWTFTYATVGGVFANGNYGPRETGYMHSIVNQYTLSDRLSYISQGDVLQTEGFDGLTQRDTYGTNQYLIYSLSDRLALGARFEWWSVAKDSVGLYDIPVLGGGGADIPGRADVYALTTGLNYRPHANVVIRPEVRYDWVRGASSEELDFVEAVSDGDRPLFDSGRDEFTFGIDTIVTF
jgi:hypothetical protein